MTIEEILSMDKRSAMSALKQKQIVLPAWKNGLEKEYYTRLHPVMDKTLYPDEVSDNGVITPVTRVTKDLMRLSVKRMTELTVGIPAQRVCKPKNAKQEEVAKWLNAIFRDNRINSKDKVRLHDYFAACEVVTIWYTVPQKTSKYGFNSLSKIRCKTYSPKEGYALYPLFDESDDMIAFSIEYNTIVNGKQQTILETYTATQHIKWTQDGEQPIVEETGASKIQAVYMHRDMPIWEDQAGNVFEIEWNLSRNGNYLRKNMRPIFGVFANEDVTFNKENREQMKSLAVVQYPESAHAQYITWDQSIENLRFQNDELQRTFFTDLQLPDWSYEKMSQIALSGEARKQLFIDCQMKVEDESGRVVEMMDREVNVVKDILKTVAPAGYEKDIDDLEVECIITPYRLDHELEKVQLLVSATGGKAIASQREAITRLGWSDNPDETMKEISEDENQNLFGSYA